MTKQITIWCLIIGLGLGGLPAVAGNLNTYIRAAGSDLTVACPAFDNNDIQWSALLYLNQTYGAEITVVVFQPSPTFACTVVSTEDNQFHLATVGKPDGMPELDFIDSLRTCAFGGGYPDIIVYGADDVGDSIELNSLCLRIQQVSHTDTAAISSLDKIYVRTGGDAAADIVLNDAELMDMYAGEAEKIDAVFEAYGPLNYSPQRFRRYNLLAGQTAVQSDQNDFYAGIDHFRLPEMVQDRLPDGPQKKNILERLDRFHAALGEAQRPWLHRVDRLELILSAYGEITKLYDVAVRGRGHLQDVDITDKIGIVRDKTLRALTEAIGIDWQGNFDIRETPFGKTGRLMLDLQISGPKEIKLASFTFHPQNEEPLVVDSMSTIIFPHQRFYRQYPIDIGKLDFTGQPGDSILFSIDVVIEGQTLNLALPYRQYADQSVGLSFLPGYAILNPFTEGQITALAQPFDWQLLITKPYASELIGRIIINTPEEVVVGTFDDNIHMPVGITARYMDIHLAAGRSIGFEQLRITAALEVSGQQIAETGADVRVIRCQIPETRDIAFVPDPEGRLEDFLRTVKASFQAMTPRSLIRAQLEAFDVIVIGSQATEYYDILRGVNARLHEFVRNGGEIIIFGQPFAWPHDIFEFPIYASVSTSPATLQVVDPDHPILNDPYAIYVNGLMPGRKAFPTYPAIITGGREIISAGEPGSYLQVVHIGEGTVIYCGLPLLEAVAELNVDAVHMMANLLNFGYGK